MWTSAALLLRRNIVLVVEETRLALRLLALIELFLQVFGLLRLARVALGLLDDLGLQLLRGWVVVVHPRPKPRRPAWWSSPKSRRRTRAPTRRLARLRRATASLRQLTCPAS